MPSIEINFRKAWRGGVSSAPFSSDGGVSFNTVGIDFISNPGVALPGYQLSGANPGTLLSKVYGEGILDVCVPDTITNRECYFLTGDTSTAAGQVGKIVGDATETLAFGPDSTRNYVKGISFIQSYKGGIYWTSETDIALDADFDWGSTIGFVGHNLTAGIPHPMIVFEDFLIIADGNYIHIWDGATGSWQALDLPTGYVITAMESWGAYIWMHAEKVSSNLTGAVTGQSSLFTWDLLDTDSWIDEFPINQRISAMKVHKGKLYLWTPSFFGEFNGKDMSDIYPMHEQLLKKDISVSDSALFFRYPIYGKISSEGRVYYDRVACYSSIEIGSQPQITFPIVSDYFGSGDSVQALANPCASGSIGTRVFWRYTNSSVAKFTLSNALFPQTTFKAAINGGIESCEIEENMISFGAYVQIQKVTVLLNDLWTPRTTFDVGYINHKGEEITMMAVNDNTSGFGIDRVFERNSETVQPTISIRPFFRFKVPSNGAVTGPILIIFDYVETGGKSIQ